MLKIILCVVALALIGLIHFAWRDMPDQYGRELEFPDDKTPTERKLIAEVQQLRKGSRVYYLHIKNRPFGIVLDEDRAHEFPEGQIDSGVLIEFKEGTRVWLRREHLKTCFIEVAH
jgi:hypothetical protein